MNRDEHTQPAGWVSLCPPDASVRTSVYMCWPSCTSTAIAQGLDFFLFFFLLPCASQYCCDYCEANTWNVKPGVVRYHNDNLCCCSPYAIGILPAWKYLARRVWFDWRLSGFPHHACCCCRRSRGYGIKITLGERACRPRATPPESLTNCDIWAVELFKSLHKYTRRSTEL